MRPLAEIVERALDGQEPDGEEGMLAIIAFNTLMANNNHDLFRIVEREAEGKATHATEVISAAFARARRCLASSPRDWIGWQNNPVNPDFQDRRRLYKAVIRNQLH